MASAYQYVISYGKIIKCSWKCHWDSTNIVWPHFRGHSETTIATDQRKSACLHAIESIFTVLAFARMLVIFVR